MSVPPLEKFKLKYNPFGTAPTKELKIWANHEELKQEMQKIVEAALISTPSRLQACVYGVWGMGKTHSALYFSNDDILKGIASKFVMNPPLGLWVLLPPRDVVDTLYIDILEGISIQRILEAVNFVRKKERIVTPELQKRMREQTGDERLARVLLKSKDIIERYLFMSMSSSELRKVGLTRGIETFSDKIRTLKGIFTLLTNTLYSRIILWIDDFERIDDFPGKELAELRTFIRDLLDRMPQKLNIILIFTLLPGRRLEDMLMLLGDAVKQRLYKTVLVHELSENDYLTYIRDLLLLCRTDKTANPYFPFEEKALRYIYSKMKKADLAISPRNINTIVSRILEEALLDEKITEIKEVHVRGILEKILPT
jgi:hypothetical protein